MNEIDRIRQLAGIVTEKSSSEKQARFMAAAAHDPEFANKTGMDQSVAKEFNRADTGTELLSKANKSVKEAHVDDCTQDNTESARDACAMEEGRTVPLPKRDANKLANRLRDEKWERHRADDEKEQNDKKPADSKEKEAVGETIELGDPDFGLESYYIIPHVGDQILAGPFETHEEAIMATKEYSWFDRNKHGIASGIDDGTGHILDSSGNPMDEDMNNGYNSTETVDGCDYFPDGADGPVVDRVGPAGARYGDNPEQKRMEVAETHTELVYAYRNFLSESAKKSDPCWDGYKQVGTKKKNKKTVPNCVPKE